MCLVCLTWLFCPLYLSCTTNLLNIFLRQHQTYILVYLTKLNGQSLCKADFNTTKSNVQSCCDRQMKYFESVPFDNQDY